MQVSKSKRFTKSYLKLPIRVKRKFDEKLCIFIKNPQESIFNNHALNGEYDGFRSINITGDYRAIFREYPNGAYEFVDFTDI